MYTRSADARLVELRAIADGQRGLFTTAQAEQAGFSYRAMTAEVDRGRWAEVAPFVFRSLPAAPMTTIETLHAATLSANALAARRSTLALVDLAPFPPLPQLLVIRTRRNLDRPQLHSTRSLPDCDRTELEGIESTAVVRATIDACGHLPRTLATRVVTKGIVKRQFTPEELFVRAEALRNPRRPGAHKVMHIVRSLNPTLGDARNEWEALVGNAARRFGLPDPVFNFRVDTPNGPRYIDAAWPPVMRGIEYDGYWEHLVSTDRFDDDRVRQSELQALGWILDRCTNRMLRKDAAAVFAGLIGAYECGGPINS